MRDWEAKRSNEISENILVAHIVSLLLFLMILLSFFNYSSAFYDFFYTVEHYLTCILYYRCRLHCPQAAGQVHLHGPAPHRRDPAAGNYSPSHLRLPLVQQGLHRRQDAADRPGHHHRHRLREGWPASRRPCLPAGCSFSWTTYCMEAVFRQMSSRPT